MTVVLASFDNPCVLCAAKADHTIEVCDKRAARFAPPTTVAPAEPLIDLKCVCACECGNVLPSKDAYIVSFGICDECDYCGPRHGCDHPEHPYYCANWPDEQPLPYDEYAASKALAADMAIPASIVAVHEDGPPCEHCGATIDHTVETCGLILRLRENVTPDFCFICRRATDHQGEHEIEDLAHLPSELAEAGVSLAEMGEVDPATGEFSMYSIDDHACNKFSSAHINGECACIPVEAFEEAAESRCFGRSCGECGLCMDGYDADRLEAEWPSFDQQVDVYYARLAKSDA